MPDPTRDPDLQGKYGKAWKFKPVQREGKPVAWQGSLGGYLVYAPTAHAVIKYYAVTLVHLRPIEGTPPAHKKYPEAEFEFMIYGLDPGQPLPDVDAWGAASMPLLRNPEVVEQFHGLDDTKARRLLMITVKAIVHGKASPDSDWRSDWARTIPGTVKHLKSGVHDPN